MTRAPLACLLGFAVSAFPIAACAITFHVNLTQDLPDIEPGDGVCSVDSFLDPANYAVCSLRAAIMEGNATPDGTAVQIRLVPGTVHFLTVSEPNPQGARAGDLDVTRPMHIGVSPDADARARIDGGNQFRAFQFHPGSSGSGLFGLEITHAVGFEFSGAAVDSRAANIELEQIDAHHNTKSDAWSHGCTIAGDARIIDSRIHHNGDTQKEMVGVCLREGAATVVRSTIDNNSSIGIETTLAELWVHTSTISGNGRAGINSTNSNATITSSTLTGNNTESIDGMQLDFDTHQTAVKALRITGTVIDNANRGKACRIFTYDDSTIIYQSFWNIFSNHWCFGGQPGGESVVSADIRLSDLGDWGGLTPTHTLLAGSPAIDSAPQSACDEIGVDQRLEIRPVATMVTMGTPCDLGAVEVQPAGADPWEPRIFADGFEQD